MRRRMWLLAALLALLPGFAQAQGYDDYRPPSGSPGAGGGDLLDGTLCTDADGFLVRTSSGNCAIRTVTNTDGLFSVQNGNGVSGNVIINGNTTVLTIYSRGTSLPSTCNVGEFFFHTVQADMYWCDSTDHWQLILSQTLATDDTTLVGNNTTFQLKTLPNGAVSYTTSTNAFAQATLANIAASTSAELRGVLSDEVGAGLAIFLDGSGNLDLGGTRTVFGTLASVTANTGSTTTTAAQSGVLFTNTGDADGSAVTMLNDPTVGAYYSVVVTAAQTITVAPGSGETLYLNAATCANVTSATVGAVLSISAVTGGSGGIWVASGAGWTCN